jgi:urease accessory protein
LATVFAVFSLSTPALAHVGHGATESLAAGLAHPLGGLDHVAVIMAVGLWAALKGGRALWLWPATFVGVMLIGGALGMVHIALPFVEPAILASVIALGLLVALAVNLPVAVGAVIVGAFALFHGHAHGSEATESIGGFEYMAGFALATAALHLTGLFVAQTMTRVHLRPVIRVAGGLCAIAGVVMIGGAM